MRDEAVDLLRPFGDAAMHFAGAIDRVAAVDAADAAAMHMAGLDEADADIAGDAAEHLPPPDDLGDRCLVHAVLQRDDIAARREILPDQERRPLRVVGLRADERDIDRRLFRELLRFGQMQRTRPRRKRLRPLVMRDAQPVFFDLCDIFRPRIDEGHVLARLRHMRAGITADRPRADDDNAFAHGSLPIRFLLPILAAAQRCRQRLRRRPVGP